MRSPLRERDARIVVAVFALGALLRVAFVVAYRPAFLGISDSGTYLFSAHSGLFSDQLHPAGYALFLRLAGALAPNLGWVIALQHVLGLVAALLLYLTVRRVTGRTLLGLIPAALVLFDGLELWAEHAPLSDPLFVALVAATLHETVRAGAGDRVALGTTGALVVGACLVRTAGVFLVPLVIVWVGLAAPGPRRVRLAGAGAVTACALVLLAGYVLVQHEKTGYTGTTQMANRALYARVAPFADCRSFSPPAGTRPLCQSTPADARGTPNSYLWGIDDRTASILPGGRRVVSPAWRVFGVPPGGDGPLGAFARTAILHQPLDYLSAVARDFHYYWAADTRAFTTAAATPIGGVVDAAGAYDGSRPAVHASAVGALKGYARWIEVRGPLMLLLLAGSLVGIALARGRERGTAALFAAATWLLLGGSVAVISVDPRYALPALGPAGVALAIGLAEVTAPQRTRRRPLFSTR